MKTALVFPGQGSQAVGMGKALADEFRVAREIFNRVDGVLDQKLSHLMFEGPEDQLTLTANAQPALMATSIATLRVLETETGFNPYSEAAYVAGHSLGEYSALCAANSLTLEDTARLLRLRGTAMQKAVPVGEGAMAAILGLDFGAVVKIATQAASDLYLTGAICQAANDNGGGQVVVSGTVAAVERAIELAKLAGAKRALLLPVSAPFHCALMQPAAEAMEEALKDVTIRPPTPPLVSNVEAEAVTDPDAIRSGLVAQVTATVRWRDSVTYMSAHGVTRFIELGSGKVLTGLIKRIVEARDDPSASARPPTSPPSALRRSPENPTGGTLVFDLTGRIALVTGASGGLGQAIARALHAQGASVALTGTRREALETLAAALETRTHAAPCDLSDAAAVEALIPAVESALGPIDILVNNAGVTRDSLFIRMKDEDWDTVLAINLTAAFRLSRASLKGMLKRRFGRIINITSVVGVQGNAGQGNYAAAKAGMIGMSKALAAEVATRGITVNCIAPGFIDSPMTRVLDQKQRDTILASIPTGRFGSDKEIGAAAVYLASSESAYMTGQTLHVNGGMAMI